LTLGVLKRESFKWPFGRSSVSATGHRQARSTRLCPDL